MKNLGIITVLALVAAACGGEEKPPPRSTTTSASSSSSGAGGQGGAGGAGGQGGQGGAGMGGSSGGPPVPVCGDFVVNGTEECDDGNTDPGDGCAADCMIEPGEAEPNDTFDKASAYKNPFPAKIDPAGDVDFVSFSVGAANTSVVARVIDVGDGACPAGKIDTMLKVLAADGTTVIASDDDGGEGYCSRAVLPSLPIGDYFVRIEPSPLSPSATFVYRLRVDLTEDVCGDGVKTPGEACDDGNTTAGDGCSPTCTIEISETEPNGTTGTADPFSDPWNGVLTPLGDVDVVEVELAASAASLTATTTDQGTNACAAKTLDTAVEILAPDGATVLASGDDIIGNCGSALATNLSAGKYFVRIKGGSLAADPSPYGLQIILQ